MDIIGIGFQLMSCNKSTNPAIQNFFQQNVANHFMPAMPPSGPPPAFPQMPEMPAMPPSGPPPAWPEMPEMPQFPGYNDFTALDPNSIVEGLGFGAMGIPQPPSPSVYMEFTQLQADNAALREEFLTNIKVDANVKKELLFKENHYEFDKNGKPVLDENGKPKLFEGKESDEQKTLRNKWEKSVESGMKDQYKKEMEEFTKYAQEVFQDIIKNGTDFLDPEKAKIREKQIAELEKMEAGIMLKYQKQYTSATCGHLPDPDSTTGGNIGSFINQQFNQYESMAAQHKNEEENSPAGQALVNYFNELKDFSYNQRQALSQFTQQIGFKDDFDPDFMKKYKAKYNNL